MSPFQQSIINLTLSVVLEILPLPKLDLTNYLHILEALSQGVNKIEIAQYHFQKARPARTPKTLRLPKEIAFYENI